MKHLALLAILAIIVINVPDELVTRGSDHFHYQREPRTETEAEFTIRHIIEQFLPIVSFGKFKSLEETGITWEVR